MDARERRRPRPEFSTLPELLQAALSCHPSSYAFNYREAGYWRSVSSEQFCEQVRRSALGLVRLGLRPGEAVGILAQPSPWWLVADFAILAAGGVSVPLFPNLSDEHLEFESKNADLRLLMVIGDEAWTVAQRHAHLYHKVVVRAVTAPRGRNVVDHHALLELGDRLSEQDPGLYAMLRAQVAPGDLATIIHTSGSTGVPKGVALTHGNLVSQVKGAIELFPADPAHDRSFSCLPLAHVFERMVMYSHIAQGMPVWFADDIKKVGELMREVKPTVMTMVPRLIEKLHARVEKQVADANGFRQRLGRWALDVAERPQAHHGWSVGVADALVYKKLRSALGGSLRYLVVGGAALAPSLERFLRNVGLPVFVGYGLTEASPVLAVNSPEHCKPGSVGKVFPGVELRIGALGEILARGPGIMKGYHRDPQATAKAIDPDGWLHTGDVGEIDPDGYLTITGRLKEQFKTSNGKYVSPVPIEQALSEHELIDMAMVVAEGRRFVTALLFSDQEALRRRKAAIGAMALSDEEFLESAAVREEIDKHLAAVNAKLDHWEQVRKFRWVTSVPTVEGEELTPTMKLRRHIIAERWASLIEEMYAEPEGGPPSAKTPARPALAGKEQTS
jgi:long-chain acyl-CoA synthetase